MAVRAYVRGSLMTLPANTAIVDAEIVVCEADGRPDSALMRGGTDNLWCFDLIDLDDCDLRSKPLIERKVLLQDLLIEADDHVPCYSSEWPARRHLLIGAERLEGIVSKRKGQRYVSGKNLGWTKVKCLSWKAANNDRSELFDLGADLRTRPLLDLSGLGDSSWSAIGDDYLRRSPFLPAVRSSYRSATTS